MLFEKIRHLVDVDENILAVFVMDQFGSISELFIAQGSKLDELMIQRISSVLDMKSVALTEKEKIESLIGRHKWDVLEYEKFKFIKLYPNVQLDNEIIIVIAASTKDAGDVANAVIGYMSEPEQDEGTPPNLSD